MSGKLLREVGAAACAKRMPPYQKLLEQLSIVRKVTGNSPLTLAEKVLYTHLNDVESTLAGYDWGNLSGIRGNSYLKLSPDRVAMQDASAQMALLQFMATEMQRPVVPASIHCDHLVVGRDGERKDLVGSKAENREVFEFLKSCADRYGFEYWEAGSGIIHQIVLENYAAPGLMMLGTDSHTPNAGGLGCLAIGVGGADAVDALTGVPWELKAPKILGIKLTGQLSGWASPKDVICKIAGLLTVKGGTGYILEYFGDGTKSLSCTGMATICNMGAEVGATTSLFPLEEAHTRYLQTTGRSTLADSVIALQAKHNLLRADYGAQYDKVIEINLSELEPQINGPFTPDLSTSLSEFGTKSEENWPNNKISVGLIGSCTNSSYEDMTRAANLIKQASEYGLKPKIPLYVSPGSEQIRATLERDGIIDIFQQNGAIVLANACGPCIGQWDRKDIQKESQQSNIIFSSFNRNFRARNDGNRNTMNFLTSPEVVTAMVYSGDPKFNPMVDSIETPDGKAFQFKAPFGYELPNNGFEQGRLQFYPVRSSDSTNPKNTEIVIDPNSDRIQALEPFEPWNGKELRTQILIKVEGKCTTDHISAAGAWLKYKGHLENISYNTLIGAKNQETGEINKAYDLDGSGYTIPELMMKLKRESRPWAVVGEYNYGEGSAREHAALSPRFLGGLLVLVKSFARIHETNLKKQGILPLTFVDEADYNRIGSGDILETVGLVDFVNNGGQSVIDLRVTKTSGESFTIKTEHTMSKDQIEFFKAGSAINYIRQKFKGNCVGSEKLI